MSSAVNDPNMASRDMASREDAADGAPPGVEQKKPEHSTTTARVAAVKRGHNLKRLLLVVGGIVLLAAIAGIVALGVRMDQNVKKYNALSEQYSSVVSQFQAAQATRMIPRHDTAVAAMDEDMSSTAAGAFAVEINTFKTTLDIFTTVTLADQPASTAEAHPDLVTYITSEADEVLTLTNTDNWDIPTASPDTYTEDWMTTTTATVWSSSAAADAGLSSSTYQNTASAVSDQPVSLVPYPAVHSSASAAITTIYETVSTTVLVHETPSSSALIHETSSVAPLSGSAGVSCICTPYTETVYVPLATAHTTIPEGTIATTQTVPTVTLTLIQSYFFPETTSAVSEVFSETSSVLAISHPSSSSSFNLPPIATATWNIPSSSSLVASYHAPVSSSSSTISITSATTETATRIITFTVGPDSHLSTMVLPPLTSTPAQHGNNTTTNSSSGSSSSHVAAISYNTAPPFLNQSTSTITLRSGGTGVPIASGVFGTPISLTAPGPKTSVVASGAAGGAGAGRPVRRGANGGGGNGGSPVLACVVMLLALVAVVV